MNSKMDSKSPAARSDALELAVKETLNELLALSEAEFVREVSQAGSKFSSVLLDSGYLPSAEMNVTNGVRTVTCDLDEYLQPSVGFYSTSPAFFESISSDQLDVSPNILVVSMCGESDEPGNDYALAA